MADPKGGSLLPAFVPAPGRGAVSVPPGAIYLFYRIFFPLRRKAGFLAACFTALTCIHVWYSRTGWGTVSCAFFFFLYFAFGYRFFLRVKEKDRRALWLSILCMTVCSLLAYGFHEMIAVHVTGMGIYLLLHYCWEGAARHDPGKGRGLGSWMKRIVRSPKTAAFVLSAIPVGVLTSGIFLTSAFAQDYWFEMVPEERGSFWTVKWFNIQGLFFKGAILEQVSYPVMVFSLLGMLVLFSGDRAFFRYLFTTMLLSILIFLAFFKDAFLVRIYLPAVLLLFLFAGEGVAFCLAFLKRKSLHWLGIACCAGLFIYLSLVSYQTALGSPDQAFYLERMDTVRGHEAHNTKYVEAPVIDYLQRHLEPEEFVGVSARVDKVSGKMFGEFSLLYYLLDAGIKSRPFTFGRHTLRNPWPRFVVGVRYEMDDFKHTVETGGLYMEVVASTVGRFALYELTEQPASPPGRKRDGR
jgi:hypothetical protein